jgi:hypothetical protein
MRRATLSAAVAALAAAALLVAGIAAAAVSPTYGINGIGTAANPTETRLVGTGSGSGGDRLTWNAELEHTALGTGAPATITGGSLSAASRGGGRGGSTRLEGAFTGGTITFNAALSSRATCGDVVYDVDGALGFDGWTGTFTGQLTQKRIRVLNRCFALMSSVSGSPGLTLTPVAPTPPASTPPPATEPPATDPPATPPPGEF